MSTDSNEIVNAEWVHDRVFLLRDHNDFPIVMTQPMGVSGADMLPMSLLGCVMWDITTILEKKRLKVVSLRASAESVRDVKPPWIFREIRIRLVFVGHNLERDQIQRTIEMSEEKYCSIYATLKQVVKITTEFELFEE